MALEPELINLIRHLVIVLAIEEDDRALVFRRFKEAIEVALGAAGLGEDDGLALGASKREGIKALLEGNDEVVAFGVLGDSAGHITEGADRAISSSISGGSSRSSSSESESSSKRSSSRSASRLSRSSEKSEMGASALAIFERLASRRARMRSMEPASAKEEEARTLRRTSVTRAREPFLKA